MDTWNRRRCSRVVSRFRTGTFLGQLFFLLALSECLDVGPDLRSSSFRSLCLCSRQSWPSYWHSRMYALSSLAISHKLVMKTVSLLETLKSKRPLHLWLYEQLRFTGHFNDGSHMRAPQFATCGIAIMLPAKRLHQAYPVGAMPYWNCVQLKQDTLSPIHTERAPIQRF